MHSSDPIMRVIAASPFGSNGDASLIRRRIKGLPDDAWGRLVPTANREGMTGILYRRLYRADILDALPESAAARLASVYYHTVAANLKLMDALAEILSSATPRGIGLVVLQGMSLQGDMYEDPGMRPMTDIDLWVSQADFAAFAECLTGLGYRQDAHYQGAFKRENVKLDIHTDLFWADRLPSRKWLLDMPAATILEAAESFSFNGLPAKRLGRPDQILYLGMHALKHNADRLIWLEDIRRLLADMNRSGIQALKTRAERLGLVPQMGFVGALLWRLMSVQSPLRDWSRGTSPAASWMLRQRDNRTALPAWSPLILFTAGKRPHLAAAMVWEMVFPEHRVLRQVFADRPSASGAELYLRRIGQLTGMLRRR